MATVNTNNPVTRKNYLDAIIRTGGLHVPQDADSLVTDLQYVLNGLNTNPFGSPVDAQALLKEAVQYSNPKVRVCAFSCDYIQGFRMITLVLSTQTGSTPKRFDRPNGIIAYAYNVEAPSLSELGYVFYTTEGGGTYRIG